MSKLKALGRICDCLQPRRAITALAGAALLAIALPDSADASSKRKEDQRTQALPEQLERFTTERAERTSEEAYSAAERMLRTFGSGHLAIQADVLALYGDNVIPVEQREGDDCGSVPVDPCARSVDQEADYLYHISLEPILRNLETIFAGEPAIERLVVNLEKGHLDTNKLVLEEQLGRFVAMLAEAQTRLAAISAENHAIFDREDKNLEYRQHEGNTTMASRIGLDGYGGQPSPEFIAAKAKAEKAKAMQLQIQQLRDALSKGDIDAVEDSLDSFTIGNGWSAEFIAAVNLEPTIITMQSDLALVQTAIAQGDTSFVAGLDATFRMPQWEELIRQDKELSTKEYARRAAVALDRLVKVAEMRAELGPDEEEELAEITIDESQFPHQYAVAVYVRDASHEETRPQDQYTALTGIIWDYETQIGELEATIVALDQESETALGQVAPRVGEIRAERSSAVTEIEDLRLAITLANKHMTGTNPDLDAVQAYLLDARRKGKLPETQYEGLEKMYKKMQKRTEKLLIFETSLTQTASKIQGDLANNVSYNDEERQALMVLAAAFDGVFQQRDETLLPGEEEEEALMRFDQERVAAITHLKDTLRESQAAVPSLSEDLGKLQESVLTWEANNIEVAHLGLATEYTGQYMAHINQVRMAAADNGAAFESNNGDNGSIDMRLQTDDPNPTPATIISGGARDELDRFQLGGRPQNPLILPHQTSLMQLRMDLASRTMMSHLGSRVLAWAIVEGKKESTQNVDHISGLTALHRGLDTMEATYGGDSDLVLIPTNPFEPISEETAYTESQLMPAAVKQIALTYGLHIDQDPETTIQAVLSIAMNQTAVEGLSTHDALSHTVCSDTPTSSDNRTTILDNDAYDNNLVVTRIADSVCQAMDDATTLNGNRPGYAHTDPAVIYYDYSAGRSDHWAVPATNYTTVAADQMFDVIGYAVGLQMLSPYDGPGLFSDEMNAYARTARKEYRKATRELEREARQAERRLEQEAAEEESQQERVESNQTGGSTSNGGSQPPSSEYTPKTRAARQ